MSEAFWKARLSGVMVAGHPWRRDAEAWAAQGELRRGRAAFNTGSITLTAAVALRAIAAWAEAKIVVEVGTFIGNSTRALKAVADHVYTCDYSNDCFEADGVTTFPHHTSLQMFKALRGHGVTADLFFFDGRLGPDDPRQIAQLASPDAVYVFDDYEGREKGVCNVERLAPSLTNYVLIEPSGVARPDTTLALLVPKERL